MTQPAARVQACCNYSYTTPTQHSPVTNINSMWHCEAVFFHSCLSQRTLLTDIFLVKLGTPKKKIYVCKLQKVFIVPSVQTGPIRHYKSHVPLILSL